MNYYFDFFLEIAVSWWIYVESRKKFEATDGKDINRWNIARRRSYIVTLIIFVSLNTMVRVINVKTSITNFLVIFLIVILFMTCIYRIYNNYTYFNTISKKDKVKLIGEEFVDIEV